MVKLTMLATWAAKSPGKLWLCSKHANLLCGFQPCPYPSVCIIAVVALTFTCEMQMPIAIVLPGFLLLVRYALLKQFHFALSEISLLSFTLLLLFLCSLKFHARFFTLITYAYCMSCCWMQVASHKQKKPERSLRALSAAAFSFMS